MLVLMAHNYYQQPGGEGRSFAAEAALLEANGHHVHRYTVHNDDIRQMKRVALVSATLWNATSYSALRRLIRRDRPAIAHFQNIFPLISPAAYYATKAESVPVVQTLRNYRVLCPNALFFRDGTVCTECQSKLVPWPGVLHGCYRKSRAATSVVAAMLSFHRILGTWTRTVDIYVALTEFSRREFIRGGLEADKLVVKPNFVHPDPGPGEGGRDYALFVGRLSPEKGLLTLLEAWRSLQAIPLMVVGSGPLMEELQASVRSRGLDHVKLLGQQRHEKVLSLMKAARFLVFPSQWYEGFPRTIVEAFACGVPVIASRLGAMAELVDDGRTGLHFRPGDPDDLARQVEWAWSHSRETTTMRGQARREFEQKYTAERNYEMLMGIYQGAMDRKQ